MDERHDVVIVPFNETYVKVFGEPGCEMDISSNYTFSVPNSHFVRKQEKYKNWDSKIRLYNRKTKLFPKGLLDELIFFLESYEYKYINDVPEEPLISDPESCLNDFIKNNNLPYEFHEYQKKSILLALNERRGIHVCGTGGGKSYIIYSIARIVPGNILIIVPSINLVHQLKSDFKEYSVNNDFDVETNVHQVYAGQKKFKNTKITISTWHSLQKLDEPFFENFDVLMVDECHTATGKQLTKIIQRCSKIKTRYGFTGTLHKWQCNKLQLYGLLGKINIIKTAKQLIDDGYLAPLKIKCIVLNYSAELCEQRAHEKWNYEDEIDFISANKKRTDMIAKLAIASRKKCLITFKRIQTQGDEIYKRILQLDPSKPVYYITGKMAGSEREEIRKKVEEDPNCIIIATESIFSTGINIKSLDVLITACPSKSSIRIIQSIGRILRRSSTTDYAQVYDIVDNMKYKANKNYALESYIERCDIYLKEHHQFKIQEIDF